MCPRTSLGSKYPIRSPSVFELPSLFSVEIYRCLPGPSKTTNEAKNRIIQILLYSKTSTISGLTINRMRCCRFKPKNSSKSVPKSFFKLRFQPKKSSIANNLTGVPWRGRGRCSLCDLAMHLIFELSVQEPYYAACAKTQRETVNHVFKKGHKICPQFVFCTHDPRFPTNE